MCLFVGDAPRISGAVVRRIVPRRVLYSMDLKSHRRRKPSPNSQSSVKPDCEGSQGSGNEDGDKDSAAIEDTGTDSSVRAFDYLRCVHAHILATQPPRRATHLRGKRVCPLHGIHCLTLAPLFEQGEESFDGVAAFVGAGIEGHGPAAA